MGKDVKRLVDNGTISGLISERFVQLRIRDYSARAKSLSQTLMEAEAEKDFDFIKRLWETTRLCPRCSLVIERSEGCNSFYCSCGHHFDFATAPRVFGKGVKNYVKVI